MPDLPVAKDHKAIQNKISLLLSSQSSLLKSLNPTPISQNQARPSARHQPQHTEQDQDQDLYKHANPNEGVGFVRQSTDPANNPASKQDKMLRGRLLGRQKKEAERKRKMEESESEEDQGRSALGKRKRKERQAQPEPQQEPDAEEVEAQDESHTPVDELPQIHDQQQSPIIDGTKKKKKKKNKNKKTKTQE